MGGGHRATGVRTKWLQVQTSVQAAGLVWLNFRMSEQLLVRLTK